MSSGHPAAGKTPSGQETRRERLRLRLFSRLNRLARPVTDYFGLEHDSAVTVETINV